MFILIITLFFLVLSAFFSASETALFSIPREKISSFENSEISSHRLVFLLLHNGQKTLMLILLGNLFVNITTIGLINTLTSEYYGHESPLITMVVATLSILFFGEILPKSIALKFNENVAKIIAFPLYNMEILISPVLNALQKLNGLFLVFFGVHLQKPTPFVTLEELKTSVDDKVNDGIITKRERDLVSMVLDKGDMPISSTMIHRSFIPTVMHNALTVDVTHSIKKFKTTFAIVKRKNEGDVIGIIYLADLINYEKKTIKSMVKNVLWIPSSTPTANALGYMFAEKNSYACVIDEYGAFVGVISLHIAMTQITKFPSKDRNKNKMLRQFSGLEELSNMLDWIPPTLKKDVKNCRTINGLITKYMGKIPKTGDILAIDGWTFYITKSKATMIESVLIRKKG